MTKSSEQKRKDGLIILLESLHKPDSKLRGCAYNQGCYEELMMWREELINYLEDRLKEIDNV
tara:strand:- start:1263 stop:1448 length:186 start_codon:yes stop_codon:yes gene_type:complete